MIFAILVVCGIAYNLLAIAGALQFGRRKAIPDFKPPVSILKPVRGRDPQFYEAIRSHALQQYPAFELIFGALPGDPAREDIERLQVEFPAIYIRIVNSENDAANGKVGSLEKLAAEARHEVLLVNDGDIRVPPDYLARVIGLLADEKVGLVTCLYRGRAASLPSKAEALGIATEFAPSVLVARLVSDGAFALGSTMAFRASGLKAIGGFATIRDYLADDYQLGARVGRVALADVIVETNLGAGSWNDVWKHQVRWSRTIRVSRPAGYFGYVMTQLTFWCLWAPWKFALAGIAVRVVAASFYTNWKTLLFVPFRDLFGFAVWAAGMLGNTVEWRGMRYKLSSDGRITRL
ncbi:MAG TPA: glycosyltransferase [Bryobacteraceae bacterium]|nr:glycosyltransferase [Bryobacteraceae bacterium]